MDATQAQIDACIQFKRVFGTEEGKQVLAQLEDWFWVHATTWCPEAPATTPYREGQRSAVLAIKKMVDADLGAMKAQVRKQEEQEEDFIL